MSRGAHCRLRMATLILIGFDGSVLSADLEKYLTEFLAHRSVAHRGISAPQYGFWRYDSIKVLICQKLERFTFEFI